MYDRPASRSVTFFSSISKPVTLKPEPESSSDNGSPTYPSPITPMLAVRLSRRSKRSWAICGKVISLVVVGIYPRLSHLLLLSIRLLELGPNAGNYLVNSAPCHAFHSTHQGT